MEFKESLLSPETLSRELFFHNPQDEDARNFLKLLKKGVPLFGFVGRGTVFRGRVFHQGTNLIFRIPLLEQSSLIDKLFGPFEKWILPNVDQSNWFSLKSEVDIKHYKQANEWLNRNSKRVLSPPPDISLSDLRCLDLRYLCGVADIKGRHINDDIGYNIEDLTFLNVVTPKIGKESILEAMKHFTR